MAKNTSCHQGLEAVDALKKIAELPSDIQPPFVVFTSVPYNTGIGCFEGYKTACSFTNPEKGFTVFSLQVRCYTIKESFVFPLSFVDHGENMLPLLGVQIFDVSWFEEKLRQKKAAEAANMDIDLR